MKLIYLVLLVITLNLNAQSWIDGKCRIENKIPLNDFKSAKKENKLNLIINQEEKLTANKTDISFLNNVQRKEFLYNFIMNPDKQDDLAQKPDKAFIRVKSFGFADAKNQLINQIKDVYFLIWSEAAQEKYGKDYVALDCKSREKIQKKFPYQVIESNDKDKSDKKPKFSGPPSFNGDVRDN
ncbi:MAG: hypothetical protein RI558_03265 [Psychroflexus sp.]|jgi:hypothetical protein|nr:hypothetical protein [Psychroflexus sp.]MDR9448229.1 hypothetical protein [Psychroflexus sp.]